MTVLPVGTRFHLSDDVRVRTSDGVASFPNIFRDDFAPLVNDFGSEWVIFEAGTEFGVVAVVEKTDTFVLAVEGEDLNGESNLWGARGLVLRKMSFDKVVNAAVINENDVDNDVETEDDSEVVDVAEEAA